MRLVLDTSVLAVTMSAAPVRAVANWILDRPSETLFTTTICQAAVLAGIAILPPGRHRADLEQAARAMFADDFRERVLPFDAAAAAAYATAFSARRRAGRPAATMDLMIASIALAGDAHIVTRNVDDFEGIGLTIINPWDA